MGDLISTVINQLIVNKIYCPILTSLSVIFVLSIIYRIWIQRIERLCDKIEKSVEILYDVNEKMNKLLDRCDDERVSDALVESKFDLIIGDLKELKKFLMLWNR